MIETRQVNTILITYTDSDQYLWQPILDFAENRIEHAPYELGIEMLML